MRLMIGCAVVDKMLNFCMQDVRIGDGYLLCWWWMLNCGSV